MYIASKYKSDLFKIKTGFVTDVSFILNLSIGTLARISWASWMKNPEEKVTWIYIRH